MTYQRILAAGLELSELPYTTNYCSVVHVTCTYQLTIRLASYLTLLSLQAVEARGQHMQDLEEQKQANKGVQQVIQNLPDVFDYIICALEVGSASGAGPVPINTVSHGSIEHFNQHDHV